MGHNITVLKNWSQKWITNLEKTIAIEFVFFYHSWNIVYKLGSFWPNFDFMMSQGLPNFQKWRKIKFFTSRNINGSKFRTFHCCLVAICCIETALKNLGKWHQTGVPISHLTPNILQKIFWRQYCFQALQFPSWNIKNTF